jgi:hypothetical protein
MDYGYALKHLIDIIIEHGPDSELGLKAVDAIPQAVEQLVDVLRSQSN